MGDNKADVHALDSSGCDPLMAAARAGALQSATLLVEHRANVNFQEATENSTALMGAARVGATALAELLLNNKANIDCQTDNGKTALFLTADALELKTEDEASKKQREKNRAETAELLLSRKAQINTVDNVGKTAFDHAQNNHQVAIVRVLEKAAADNSY